MKYLFTVGILMLFSCNSDDESAIEITIKDLSTTVQYNQIDGIDSNLLSLDIYHINEINNQKPVVVYVHGGAWSIGDKINEIDNKVNLFQSLNYVFISVNYRLSPFPYELDNPDRVMYPAHNNDVADAIKWIKTNINKYGGNPNKLVLLGHSAGAHLVTLTGTNSTFLENVGLSFNNIKGIAAIDTEGYNVVDKINTNLYINAFGTNNDLNTQASPVLNIKSNISYPKFFIAKRGNSERIAITDDFINTLEQNNVSVSQIDGSIYTHSGINNAIGDANETLITNPLVNFLEDCFE